MHALLRQALLRQVPLDGQMTSQSSVSKRQGAKGALARRQTLRVCAQARPAKNERRESSRENGAKGKGNGGSKGGSNRRAGAAESQPLEGEAAMREFARDETLLFTPVPPQEGSLSVAYAYPNTYTVGITSLGYQLVWAYMATRPDVDVRRLFMDAHEPMHAAPQLVGFSLSWELDYANVLTLLERMGVPLLSVERTDEHPLVFGGGPVLTGNPEPYAAFFDIVLLGDGETLLGDFLAAVAATRSGGATRAETLLALARVPGVYIPSLFETTYHSPDGLVASVTPLAGLDIPAEVTKQTYRGQTLARSTVVSPKMAWEDIYMVEVVRSCPEMCRFCLASYLTLPFRAAPLESSLLPAIADGLRATRRLGLLGASVTQHPEFEQLIDHLMQPEFADVRLSIASVRAGTVTPRLAAALAQRGTKSLTIAVESGSARMRRIVNKKLDAEEIVAAALAAQEGGLDALKLYGMVGLPGETDADVDATVDMLRSLRLAAPRLRLTFGCSTFVPKPHTPFQWYGVSLEGEKRLDRLEKELRRLGIEFRPESFKWSIIQGMLSRGDRRLTPLLLAARGFGDSLGSYRRAFKGLAGSLPPLEHYAHRSGVPGQEVLPWAHLRGPLPERTLVQHAEEAAGHMLEAPTGRFLVQEGEVVGADGKKRGKGTLAATEQVGIEVPLAVGGER